MERYFEVLGEMPLPSKSQTERFADFVASAHSWSRHLPLFPPGAQFVLFLDWNAGRHLLHKGGRYTARDFASTHDCAHHSQRPTSEYRSRFGHWNYWICDNPRRPDREKVAGPWIDPDTGELQPLPVSVIQKCSCRLTAFLKPGGPETFDLKNASLQAELRRFSAQCGWFSGWFQSDPEIQNYRNLARWIRRKSARWFLEGSECAIVEQETNAQHERLLQALMHARTFFQHQLQPV